MSIVERMLPWDRQPPGPAELANQRQVFGYSRNRIFLARPGGTSVIEPTLFAATPDSAGQNSVAGSYDGSTSGWYCSPVFTVIPSDATLIAMVRPAVADSAERTVLSLSDIADENPLFRLETNSNVWRFQIRGSTTAANIAGTTAVVAGTMAIVGGVYRDSTREKSLWVNGRKEATDTTSLGSGTFSRTTLGVLSRSGTGQFFSGLIYEAHILPFAASDAWMADATKSPKQLFAAIYAPRRIWVPVSSGATPRTETASLSAAVQAARTAAA
ncbi:MAG: hypothetical protein RJA36_1260, partial [Pseudomonadota bacterium]